MNLEERVEKYIAKVEAALKAVEGQRLNLAIESSKAAYVLELARMYWEDAMYFREKGDLGTALATVSYSEGLLDALRIMGVVEFEWV